MPERRQDDVEPDNAMDLARGQWLPPHEDVELALTVPFTDAQLSALEGIARERGISAVDAVQRLVEEALEARAHRPAA